MSGGTANARSELHGYLRRLHRRLRLGALARGTAIAVVAALAATIMLVLLLEMLLFSARGTAAARLALWCVIGIAVIAAIGWPLWRLTYGRAAATAEARFPPFQQRLVTFTERYGAERDGTDPFIELLAADTLEVARAVKPGLLTRRTELMAWLATGAVSAGVLVWLIAAAPGMLGYGTHLLWTNAPRGSAPSFDIRVSPGNATVRRFADQLVTALPKGKGESSLFLYAHYQSSSKWERIAMQAGADRRDFQFTLTGVPETLEYYVASGARHSPRYTLRVADPPSIRKIRVTYHYPKWTGLPDDSQESGGDLRALKGTQADLEVTTDRPLDRGMLVLDRGRTLALAGGESNHYRASIEIQEDGAYHLATLDHGQPLRVSEDYFIEARERSAPSISIVRPGGDYRASPIEEVSVAVHASDDYGLEQLELHYAVNGGAEQTLEMLPKSGAKQADGHSVLALEKFKLVPGDIVSLYATAKDSQLQAHTDIAFIQVEPFSREFSQSQASGGAGGGGAGNESNEISQREKEIIAATFHQLNEKSATAKQAAETAQFLNETQTALRKQALALAGRLRSRELSDLNSEFGRFQQEMREAADAMSPSAEQLQRQNWQQAVPEEQKVLQHLLRAEAVFRDIEIAYGSRGGGSGAGRDLASLFDLELDTEKNQYETQQRADPKDQRATQVNEALKKLDELARRQDDIAQQQREDTPTPAEQRWQQEMLEREAEQLQRQIEQLAQSPANHAGATSAQAAAAATAQARAVSEALDRLREAQQGMARAGANERGGADARLAAERLREAGGALGGLQSQEAARRLDSIARDAQRLAADESAQSRRIDQLKARGPNAPQAAREVDRLTKDRQALSDALDDLQQNMRNAARELDAAQRGAADQLRGALKDLDDADLAPLIQRSADWLRTGIDPNSADTESRIAAGLSRLSAQTRDAQQSLKEGEAPPGAPGSQAALDGLARLRQGLEAIAAPATSGQSARVDGGGAARQGFVDNNIDTGNNARGGAAPRAPVPAAALHDAEQAIQQGLGELRALRLQPATDPATRRQVDRLIDAMEHLDLKRFPGNPAMIEKIHEQLLGEVDTLELALRQAAGEQYQVRTAAPPVVPNGYEDAVADYFRRLSNR